MSYIFLIINLLAWLALYRAWRRKTYYETAFRYHFCVIEQSAYPLRYALYMFASFYGCCAGLLTILYLLGTPEIVTLIDNLLAWFTLLSVAPAVVSPIYLIKGEVAKRLIDYQKDESI